MLSTCPHPPTDLMRGALHSSRLLCSIPAEVFRRFQCATSTADHERGATLFRQGEQCGGVFELFAGKAKITAFARNGNLATLKIAREGELLGLSEALLNLPFQATAEAAGPCSTRFIPRKWLIAIMTQSSEIAIQVAEQLGSSYLAALSTVLELKLSTAAPQRLAKFILESCGKNGSKEIASGTALRCTHAEIAQAIGCSRETVTRLFRTFRQQNLITVKNSFIHIERAHELRRLSRV